MKKKVIFIFAVTAIMVFAMALTAVAAEFRPYDGSKPQTVQMPIKAEIELMINTFEKQQACGFIAGEYKIAAISYSGEYMQLFAVTDLTGVTVTINGATGGVSHTAKVRRYRWNTSVGWLYNTETTNFSIYTNNLYYSAVQTTGSAAGNGFIGINESATYGTKAIGVESVNNYFEYLYDSFVNREQNEGAKYNEGYAVGEQDGYEIGLDDGYDAGYAAGYQTGSDEAYTRGFMDGKQDGFTEGYNTGLNKGKTECEKTHLTLQEQAYGDGYDMGQEMCEKTHNAIRQAGYDNGLYDCEQTHEDLLRGQYEEGWYVGNATGYNDGFGVGKAEGYTEGFEARGTANAVELKEKYAEGFANGKDAGITEALNSGKAINDYVDGLFSAPINFLYKMLDVEILGVNLFNVTMVILTILIVGAVVLLIMKFR